MKFLILHPQAPFQQKKEGAIQTIHAIKDMQHRSETLRCEGKRIAFVPTMGYLHEGHLSLVRLAKAAADDIVASIFVNPTQFGPGEDLDSYPRNLEKDLDLLENEGVTAVFLPDAKSLYGNDFQTYVSLERLPIHLCGLSRPQFFRGVATVVTKLFNIVRPHLAVFGEKDFQQLQVIRQMSRDLNFDIEIVGGPIVRESDGLAMSSRNAYLSKTDRPAALSLYQSLVRAKEMARQGERDAAALIAEARRQIETFPEARIDYVAIFDADTFENAVTVTPNTRMALAVWVGKARLIDNMAVCC